MRQTGATGSRFSFRRVIVIGDDKVFRFEGDAEARRLSNQALDRELGLDGQPPDPVAATQLLRAAAERGNIRAAISLSVCLRDGKGTAPDPVAAASVLDVAMKTLRQAADQGDPVADVILADLFERGLGVGKSRAAAYAHLRRAAAGRQAPTEPLNLAKYRFPDGEDEYMRLSAADRCKRLEDKLDAAERAEAEQLYAALVAADNLSPK
jgi:TPR repeat protein